jgi:hypothetical protein
MFELSASSLTKKNKMKKLTILSAIVLFTAAWVSCSKENVNRPPSSTVNNPVVDPVQSVTIISDWVDLELNLVNDRGIMILQGRDEFNTRVEYDKNTHVELAYAFIPGQRNPEYRRLPMKYVPAGAGPDEYASFAYNIDDLGFLLTIRNNGSVTTLPDASAFQDFEYRYIVLPKTKYESLNVNWDDYNQVAIVLNL